MRSGKKRWVISAFIISIFVIIDDQFAVFADDECRIFGRRTKKGCHQDAKSQSETIGKNLASLRLSGHIANANN